MEQLIFVGILLFFSVLEAIARKGKQRRGSPPPEGELPRIPETSDLPRPRLPEPRAKPEPEVVATYDADPSFDDEVEVDEPRPRRTSGPAGAPVGSEGMVPAEVWEEILALARGGGPRPAPGGRGPSPAPRPRPKPPMPTRREAPRPAEVAGRSRPAPLAPRSRPAVEEPIHPVHLTHPSMGRPLSERRSPLQTAEVVPPNRDVRAARSMLGGGSVVLRQAMVLGEILGPPAALRGDPYDPD